MNGRSVLVTLTDDSATRRAHEADKIHVTPEGVLVLMDRSEHVLVAYAAGAWLSAQEQN